MTICSSDLQLPVYQRVTESILALNIPISGSELHGILCGYLSAGASQEGIAYLRAFITKANDDSTRHAARVLFDIYTISQQQIETMGFEFQLLLPDDSEALLYRAQSFTEWCDGFTQGIRMAGVEYEQIQDDDALDAIQHITEFAELDYESLQFDGDDERALTEISEYARMAVLHIYSDLHTHRATLDAEVETKH